MLLQDAELLELLLLDFYETPEWWILQDTNATHADPTAYVA